MGRSASEDVIERGQRAKRVKEGFIAIKAREDPVLFNAYVLRDEFTGQRIQLAPMHAQWQDIVSTLDRAIIIGHLESGKSNQITIGRVLWELGKNPELRIIILSNTSTQAKKFLSSIRRYIERSEELKHVFPHLKPGQQWTDSSITVERKSNAKDPSITAIGVHGAALSARVDLLVMDDILDWENTRTPEARVKVYNWVASELLGRSKRVIGVGNAYHRRDAYHRWEAEGWRCFRYPVVRHDGTPTWPARWPMSAIEKKRHQLSPVEFARQYLCITRDEEDARFQRDWLEEALRRGAGKTVGEGWATNVPPGYKVVTGLDLNVQRHAGADLACLFSIVVHPNEDREVLEVESGRWGGPETFRRMLVHARRWLPHVIMVENNGAQDFFVQFTSSRTALPVVPFTTGENKASPEYGVESVGVEMMHKKWIIPAQPHSRPDERDELIDSIAPGASNPIYRDAAGPLRGASPEIDAWIDDLLQYQPEKHTPDRVMAMWLAREGISRTAPSVEWGRVR